MSVRFEQETMAALGAQAFEYPLPENGDLLGLQSEIRPLCTDRRKAIWELLLGDVMPRPGLTILELGVFQASNVRHVMSRYRNVVEYTGVDDYGAGGANPYISRGGYWKDGVEAEAQYQKSRAIFDEFGQALHRDTSDGFLSRIPRGKQWDIVFVDGNHTYEYALRDMKNYLAFVASGGILLVDDYGNADCPDVTRAVTAFMQQYGKKFARVRGLRLPFINASKSIPISLTVLAFFKK